MEKEKIVYSILCKKELEYNLDKLLEIVNRGTVNEENVAKICILWSSSLSLMLEFEQRHQPFQISREETFESSIYNMQTFLLNHLDRRNMYDQFFDFVTHDAFCGFVAQTINLPKLSSNPVTSSIGYIHGGLNQLDNISSSAKCSEIGNEFRYTLDAQEILANINDAPASSYQSAAVKRWLSEELKKTHFSISSQTYLNLIQLIPFSIFCYAMVTGLYFGALSLLSIGSLIIMEAKAQNNKASLSSLETSYEEIVESRAYLNCDVSDDIADTIANNWTRVSRANYNPPSAPPIELDTTAIPAVTAYPINNHSNNIELGGHLNNVL